MFITFNMYVITYLVPVFVKTNYINNNSINNIIYKCCSKVLQ